MRILDGAVTLMRTDDAATYKVFDLQRDGVRMSEAIESFRDEVRTEQQVEVQLDSLFMFPPNWQFNMVIRNDASEPLFLDANSLIDTSVWLDLAKRRDGQKWIVPLRVLRSCRRRRRSKESSRSVCNRPRRAAS